jgi:outer membrane receptor protein involved in Fe transport
MMRVVNIIATLALSLTFVSAQSSVMTGTVTDASGAVVDGASVKCVTNAEVVTTTSPDGTFNIDATACPSKKFVAEAPGFGSAEFTATAAPISVVLEPRPIDSRVTVTGTSRFISESSASVAVLATSRLALSPGLTLDDKLRQVPGFTLFRRTGSRTANPTTQGVSLRGVGASGASRALVLKDGIPLNDPFGSWVYWGRAVSESVSEVEILRGSGGDIYGTAAVGGVVSIHTLRPSEKAVFSMDGALGDGPSPYLSAYGSMGHRWLRGSLAAEVFNSPGYIPVDKASRGGVDTRANVRRSTVEPTVEVSFDPNIRAFASGEFYREVRDNGSPLQTNDTHLNSYSGGLDALLDKWGTITARAFGGRELYHQSFSAIADDRSSETLSRLQTVPVKVAGAHAQWTLSREANSVFAGIDLRKVQGTSQETGYSAGRATSASDSGGREKTIGVFAGTSLHPVKRFIVDLSARYDRWHDLDGSTITRSLTGPTVTEVRYPDRTESAFSPRAGFLAHLDRHFSITASASRSFRQATLNELYRSFRAGNVLTTANPFLRAERGTTGEAGVIINAVDERLYARMGPYCTRIEGPVANVTLTVTPSLITRQRQNLGRTLTCGLEADLEFRISTSLSVSGGYLWASTRVLDSGSSSLDGLRLPQIPRDQWNLLAVYSRPRFGPLSIQLRGSGSQFEDDLNTAVLRGFVAADVFYSHRLSKHLSIYGAVENLTNTRIEAGRTPVITLAQPRTGRIGFRLHT